MAVTVPPTLTISKWIGQLKGGVSHDGNHRLNRRDCTLEWQAGYGVIGFGAKDLDWVVQYIRNQREHHAQHATYDRLDRMTNVDNSR